MCRWSPKATTSRLAIIRLPLWPLDLCEGVRRLRRRLRDVRDRMARHKMQWRDVCFAGLVGGDGLSMLLISYDGMDRQEVLDVLRRRWPQVVVKSLEQEAPTMAMRDADLNFPIGITVANSGTSLVGVFCREDPSEIEWTCAVRRVAKS